MRIKYPPPEAKRWAIAELSDIPSKIDPNLVYLRRLRIVQTPWCALYLHWINEPDAGRHPHDHPWAFWSLILRGGYTEDVFLRLGGKGHPFDWKCWSLHRMSITRAHQITLVRPNTITLVFTGRRQRNWCFWTEANKVPWREYLAEMEPSDVRADQAPEA